MYRTYNARPLPRAETPKRSFRKLLFVLAVVLLLVAGYCALALLRPLPAIHTTITPPVTPSQIKVNIPWPTTAPKEEAAFGADGYGLLASSGPLTPVPTASVTKVITAMAVLNKKPLKSGEAGPTITLTAHDVDLYNQYVAEDGSVVPVTAGETISEYQALQAMMLPSANNIADTLAEWAFGSLSAYNQFANSYVKTLGMTSTTVTDASGFTPTTVSTARDLVLLGDATLDNPVLAEIINQKTAEFPGYGTMHNVNSLLGTSSIRGIKTGNTDEAGGCFLSAADVMIGDKKITVITAVMSAPNLPDALRSSLPLVQSAPSQFQTVRAVRAGQVVGHVTTGWGAASDITADKDVQVTAWSGTAIVPIVSKTAVQQPTSAHAKVGSLSLKFNGTTQSTDLELRQAITPPTLWWRLSHPL
jgi:D-alanyl-D-alanine carboxypeptidase (penicillin-binding protein 5/6)